jgi:hypothetical protein
MGPALKLHEVPGEETFEGLRIAPTCPAEELVCRRTRHVFGGLDLMSWLHVLLPQDRRGPPQLRDQRRRSGSSLLDCCVEGSRSAVRNRYGTLRCAHYVAARRFAERRTKTPGATFSLASAPRPDVREGAMEVTLVSWWVLVAGAAGGALNAGLSGTPRLLPSVRRFAPRGTPSPALGLLGNAGVGAGTATATRWALANAACGPASLNESSLIFASGVCLCLGWAMARWVTTESGNVVLRQAVCRAATAPAAHPATIRTMLQTASAEAIYNAVDELVPRRAEHS